MEAAGVRDVLTKCLGTNNPHNVAKATVLGLKSMETLRDVAQRRNVSVAHLMGREDEAESGAE